MIWKMTGVVSEAPKATSRKTATSGLRISSIPSRNPCRRSCAAASGGVCGRVKHQAESRAAQAAAIQKASSVPCPARADPLASMHAETNQQFVRQIIQPNTNGFRSDGRVNSLDVANLALQGFDHFSRIGKNDTQQVDLHYEKELFGIKHKLGLATNSQLLQYAMKWFSGGTQRS